MGSLLLQDDRQKSDPRSRLLYDGLSHPYSPFWRQGKNSLALPSCVFRSVNKESTKMRVYQRLGATLKHWTTPKRWKLLENLMYHNFLYKKNILPGSYPVFGCQPAFQVAPKG